MENANEFGFAQERVKTLGRTPGPAQLLQLYALYKQGSLGDVAGERPGVLDFKGRAKYDAWAKHQGMSKSDAQNAYVKYVSELLSADGQALNQ
jgi:acyl-CoA-binding protein